MGGIAVHEFITLDGVVETPTWTIEYPFDRRMGHAIGELMGASRALLLGRRTYEMFAPVWSARSAEDDPGAPFMNESPKYIVSRTLEHPSWANSVVLGAYDADAIRALKERVDGKIYVSGSVQLVRALLVDQLADELHLFVFPIALGEGLRLFADGGGPFRFSLAACEAFDSGVVYLNYHLAG
jgi:dihydrofolate reductase